MQNIKKFVALGLLALGLFVHVSAQAAAVAPKHSGGIVFPDPSFIGMKVARINSSASPVVLSAGPLLLYAICPTGGTIGKYAVAYDYLAGVGNVLAGYIDPAASSKGQYLASPLVHTHTGTYVAGTPDGEQRCWVPPWPIRIANSLAGYTNDSANNVLYFYRLNTGVND